MTSMAYKLHKLYLSNKTVFATSELMHYLELYNKDSLYVVLNRMVKNDFLKRIKQGLYALNVGKIDPFEIAGNIYKNVYISFETVLFKEGITNQEYFTTYFLAVPRTLTIENSYGTFQIFKMPDFVLANRQGVEFVENRYLIATKERAVCDLFYKFGVVDLDDPLELDPEKLEKVAKIYRNKRLESQIHRLADGIRRQNKMETGVNF